MTAAMMVLVAEGKDLMIAPCHRESELQIEPGPDGVKAVHYRVHVCGCVCDFAFVAACLGLCVCDFVFVVVCL